MKYLKIKKNVDFQKLFNRGKKVFSPAVTLIYFPAKKLSMGLAVSKKHGKAVKRNRIKRLLREAFYQTAEKLNRPYAVILVPKVAEEYTFDGFKKSLTVCFGKVNKCA